MNAHSVFWVTTTATNVGDFMNGGDIIGAVLAAQGVKHVFTLCGGHISPILVGAKQRGIRIIDVRSEANAVFAADATRDAHNQHVLTRLASANVGQARGAILPDTAVPGLGERLHAQRCGIGMYRLGHGRWGFGTDGHVSSFFGWAGAGTIEMISRFTDVRCATMP